MILRKLNFLLGVLLTLMPLSLTANSYIPLNNPIYFEIDRLKGLGYLNSLVSLSKPYNTYELKIALDEIKESHLQAKVSSLIKEIERYEANNITDSSISVAYSNEDTNIRYQEGLSLEKERVNTVISTRLQYTYDNLSFVITPTYRNTLDKKGLLLGDTYALYSFDAIDISIGREALWWGVGKHGTLLLSNNAQSIDMVRVSSKKGLEFDMLSLLGPIDFDVLFGRFAKHDNILNPDRSIASGYPKIFAAQISIHPTKNLQLGIYRTAIFGGADRSEDLETIFNAIFPFTGVENSPTAEQPGDQKGGFTAMLTLPNKIQNLTLYAEAAGEDEAGMWPSKWSYILGVDLIDLAGFNGLNLNVEYMHMSDTNVWYRHHIYQDGYTNKNFILGHAHGGVGSQFDIEMIYQENLDSTYKLGYRNEKFSDETVETINFSARYRMESGIELNLEAFLSSMNSEEFGAVKLNTTLLNW